MTLQAYKKRKEKAHRRHALTVLGINDERPCGECRACCVSLIMEDFDKWAGEPCQHLCDKFCGIYAQRPNVCRDFYCFYRESTITPDWAENCRPDNLGFFFMLSTTKVNALIIVEACDQPILTQTVFDLAIQLCEKLTLSTVVFQNFDCGRHVVVSREDLSFEGIKLNGKNFDTVVQDKRSFMASARREREGRVMSRLSSDLMRKEQHEKE